MDYSRFIDQLPGLYDNWRHDSVEPKSPRFRQVVQHVQGMTTPNVLQLLNWAVGCLEGHEAYCEIGSFRGATLIGALLDQAPRLAYAVDNFFEFDRQGENFQILMANLSQFGLIEGVLFHNQDFQEFFLSLRDVSPRIGVYFYDGAHDYRSQLLGLLLAKPFLAERALIVVDDSNLPAVKQANWDFMATNPECRLLLDLPTPGNCHPTWWNGLHVLAWDGSGKSNYDRAKICRRKSSVARRRRS